MNKKVLIWSLVCLFFVTLLLTGCGGGSTPPSSAPDSKESATSPGEAESTPAEQSSSSEEEIPVSEIFARAKNIEGLYYEYVLTAGEEKTEGKAWIKGKQFKNEICVEDQTIINIIDFDKAAAYTYMPSQNTAMKIELDMMNMEEFQSPTAYAEDVDPQLVRIVETTTYDGYRCKVMAITNEETQEEIKMWVSEDYGIPLRIEAISEGVTTVLEYKNLQVGSIADDVFTIPQGVEIMEMDMSSAISDFSEFMPE